VEQEGIRRALDRGAAADLVLALRDPFGARDETVAVQKAERLQLVSKADLIDSDSKQSLRAAGQLPVSALTGEGLDALVEAIGQRLHVVKEPLQDLSVPTRIRHRVALEATRDALRSSESSALPLELRAEELRRAGDALGRLTGRIDVEDMLDVIFREFCIGK